MYKENRSEIRVSTVHLGATSNDLTHAVPLPVSTFCSASFQCKLSRASVVTVTTTQRYAIASVHWYSSADSAVGGTVWHCAVWQCVLSESETQTLARPRTQLGTPLRAEMQRLAAAVI